MTIDQDPYRVLGLARSATADEIKRAYRRLAKINHPDAAGPSALPRFLAIQAAYEQLIGRPATNGRRSAAPPPPRVPGRPTRAGPAPPAARMAVGARARRRAAGQRHPDRRRPRARRRRPATPGPTGGPAKGSATGRSSGAGRAGAGQGTTGRTGRRRAAGSETAGAPGTPPGAAPGDAPNRSGRTKRNKATLGSTSYDGADGPFEPDWRGASWYGTTSGTYWTLNPKEYADPRKHGPEYQARARRATQIACCRSGGGGPAGPGGRRRPSRNGRASRPPPIPPPARRTPPARGGSRPPALARRRPRRRLARHRAPAAPGGARPAQGDQADPPPPDLGRAAADIARAIGDDRIGGVRGRVARAIIGWLPIAFGIGWLLGEVTGCGRFAATCDGSAEPFVLLLQVGVAGAPAPRSAGGDPGTTAAVALLAAAVVATLILSATGTAADEGSRRATLGAVLLIAWLAGLGIGVMRRLRSVSMRGRPVS